MILVHAVGDRIRDRFAKYLCGQTVELETTETEYDHVMADGFGDRGGGLRHLMLQRAGDPPSVALAAVLPVLEHLDVGLAERCRWIHQQVERASDGERWWFGAQIKEPVLCKPIPRRLTPAVGTGQLLEQLRIGVVHRAVGRGRLETSSCPTADELVQLLTEQRGVHRTAAHQHTAVSRLRVALHASRHRDGQDLHALDVKDMKGVATRTMNPRDDSMDPRLGLTVGVRTDRATTRIDTDQDRPATRVRERGDGLGGLVLRHALLELEHVRFAGEPRVELDRGQPLVIHEAPLANFFRPDSSSTSMS